MFNKKVSPSVQVFLAILLSVCLSLSYTRCNIHSPLLEENLLFVGNAFISALQLFAVPLVLFSIINSMSSIKDTKQFSRLGFFVFVMYLSSTFFAVCLGLLLGSLLQPGRLFRRFVSLDFLKNMDFKEIEKKLQATDSLAKQTNTLPTNLFAMFTDNKYLLYVVLFAMVFGFALLQTKKNKAVIFQISEGLQETFSRMMRYLIKLAPIGVFCLVSSQLLVILRNQTAAIHGVFVGLSLYVASILLGLSIMLFIVYPMIVSAFSNTSDLKFIRVMRPAQLLAFSTSSSTGTLYKTDQQVGKLNVSQKIRSFVLSLGATVNMDGTALYQGLTTLFITQLVGQELTLMQQMYIAGYVALASVGVAGIPGASLVTTSILLDILMGMNILTSFQIKLALGIIYIPDTILDRVRTMANVTGDAAVAILAQRIENGAVSRGPS